MTKEMTIDTLDMMSFETEGNHTPYENAVYHEAVSTAVAALNSLQYLKDYLEVYINKLEEIELDCHKEIDVLEHVKAFIEGYEKGVFK